MTPVSITGSTRLPAAWRAPGFFLLAAGTLSAIYVAVPSLHVQEAIYQAVGLAAVVAIALGVRRHRPSSPVHWWLVALGFALLQGGDLIWYGYEWFLGREAPFPSLADAVYLPGYPLITAGVVIIHRRARRGLRPDTLDTAIVATACAMVLWVVLIGPQIDGGGTVLARLTAAAYPAMDALLLVALVRLALTRSRNPARLLLTASIGLLFTADLVYGVQSLHGTYVSGSWLDLGWLLSYACAGAAGLHPSMRHADAPVHRASASPWARLVVLAAASLTTVGLLAAQEPRKDDDFVVAVVAGVLNTILIFVRLGLLHARQFSTSQRLQRDKERLSSIEEAQRQIADGELELDELMQALTVRTQNLLGVDGVAIALQESEGLVLRFGSGVMAPHAGDMVDGDRSLARATLDAGRTLVSNDVQADERVDPVRTKEVGVGSLAATPLDYAGQRVGALVAMTRRPNGFGPRKLDTLQLMASLLSVAMSKSSEFAARRALDAIVESTLDAIIGTTLDGTILSWNAAAQDIFGYASEEAVGRPIGIIVPPDRAEEAAGYLERLGRGQVVDRVETEGVTKDGRRIPASLTIWPVRDLQGRVVGVSAIVRDVTERKQLEERLHHAQKMEAVGRLAGGIAHDFNNLLLAIQGYGELLLRDCEQESTRRHAVEIRTAAARAAELTQQLLAYSRKQVLKPQVLSLNEIVTETNRMLERLVGEDVVIECRLADGLGAVRADPSQLGQVIVNLALNARDAMPGGGTLTIETESVELDTAHAAVIDDAAPGRYVRLTVSDTGTGMDEVTRRRAFEPFFTTKPQGQGTGLGLATVYGTVKQSGGSLALESEPGRGATLSIYLPELQEPALTERRPEEDAAVARGSETIMLVEDEDTVRSLVGEMLSTSGYRVVVAASADDALARSASIPTCDLLVTDVVMPGMNGVELAERFLERHPSSKVILTSGYASEAILGHGGLAAGATFLHKPFTLAQLAGAVRTVLDG